MDVRVCRSCAFKCLHVATTAAGPGAGTAAERAGIDSRLIERFGESGVAILQDPEEVEVFRIDARNSRSRGKLGPVALVRGPADPASGTVGLRDGRPHK